MSMIFHCNVLHSNVCSNGKQVTIYHLQLLLTITNLKIFGADKELATLLKPTTNLIVTLTKNNFNPTINF